MTNFKKISVSVVVPIHNSATILNDTLDSLEKQDYSISEIFIIDNNSTDNSLKIAENFAKHSRFKIIIIRQKEDRGLAHSYNQAINLAKTTHLITLQSDCIIPEKDDMKKLLKPFGEDNDVVVSCSLQMTPWKVWEKYNFWQKCLFSRHVGKPLSGRNGRFCCFSIEALKSVGLFNEQAFRTAGEDGDILFRLSSKGKIIDVDVVVKHLHSMNNNFSIGDYIYKENQLAEAVGACLGQNFGKIRLIQFSTAFLRIFLILGLFIPILRVMFVALILIYSVYLTKNCFLLCWRDARIFLLLFINIFLLFSYSFYFVRGLITKKQRL